MSTWNEDELIGYCEKLIAKKSFIVAEEILWEITKRNRSNLVVLGLLGRLYEETKQFELASKLYESALVMSPDDPELKARRDACRGRQNDTRMREDLAKLHAGKAAIVVSELLRSRLHYTEITLDITQQQIRALRQQVWPEIAALPSEHWTLSDADIDALTMGGKAIFKFSQGYAANHLAREAGYPQIYTDEQIDRFLKMIGAGDEFCYRGIDAWLYEALESYPINGLEGIVIGSLSPWYESVCLHYGARPTVADYTKIICKTERIRSISVEELYKLENAFDFAISISSIEHDGLGGYETPVEPDADLLAMRKLSQVVKPGGFAFFNVPIGLEKVTYPTYRTYGRTRFPKLIEGWRIEKDWGFDDANFDIDDAPQPLLVLRNAK